MVEREVLKKLLAEALHGVQHEDANRRKYMDLARQAAAEQDRHRIEAAALTQLLELYYPDEKPVPF